MNRQEFLTSFQKKKSSQDFNAIERTKSGLAPYTGPWSLTQVTHLLKRCMFGSKKADIDYLKTKTMDAAVNELVNTAIPAPDPPVNNYNAGTPDPDVAAG